MQLTLDIPNEKLFNNIVWFLARFKDDGVKIITENNQAPTPQKGLDFSAFEVKSFKELNGLEFQKKTRDEWYQVTR